MKLNRILSLLTAAIILTVASVASAHPGHTGHDAGFVAGMSHPISGIDHILAMVGVGLLAAQMGGRAVWILPFAFVGLMCGGGLLNLAHVSVPMVEQGIMASVLVLGLMIAGSARLPIIASAALVGLFAIFHGFAHVAEMSGDHSALLYAGGFVTATITLHAVGIGIGLAALRFTGAAVIRVGGTAIAACGLLFILHVL